MYLLAAVSPCEDYTRDPIKPLSIYRTELDARAVINAHKKSQTKGGSWGKFGFSLSKDETFIIIPVVREQTFGEIEIPSWIDDMKKMENTLDELMKEHGEIFSLEEEDSPKQVRR